MHAPAAIAPASSKVTVTRPPPDSGQLACPYDTGAAASASRIQIICCQPLAALMLRLPSFVPKLQRPRYAVGLSRKQKEQTRKNSASRGDTNIARLKRRCLPFTLTFLLPCLCPLLTKVIHPFPRQCDDNLKMFFIPGSPVSRTTSVLHRVGVRFLQVVVGSDVGETERESEKPEDVSDLRFIVRINVRAAGRR